MLKALYQTFLQERRFLKNCSPMTLRSYRQAWNAFESVLVSVKTTEDVRAAVKRDLGRDFKPGVRSREDISYRTP